MAANRAVAPLLAGVDAALLRPPVNVLRLGLHPAGLAPRTVNLAEWREHLLERLRRQITIGADPALVRLLEELRRYPAPEPASTAPDCEPPAVVVPFRLATEFGVLSLFSTITVFGTPVDVTLAELALETFFPADAASGAILRRLVPEPAASAA